MKNRLIYIFVYLLIAIIVYAAGIFFKDYSQNNRMIQFAIFFGLAAVVDKVIKKFFTKGKDSL